MTVELKVTVAGLDQLQRRFEEAPAELRREMKATMNDAVLLVERAAKEKVPTKTTTLARSIHSKVSQPGGVLTGTVGTNLKYGPFVEQGTGIYHTPDAHQPWTVVAQPGHALAIPVAAGTEGANPLWAVSNGARQTDAQGRALFRTAKGGTSYKEGSAAQVLFRTRVTIRGMKPRPYLLPAFKEQTPEIKRRFRLTLVKIAQRMKGG